MREVKFRGKNVNGDWAYGDRVVIDEGYGAVECIWSNTEQIGIPVKNVGQYTGLKSKSGIEIYEGDIIRAGNGYGLSDEIVEIKHRGTGLYPVTIKNRQKTWKAVVRGEIIGNIYDNKELLREVKL